MNHLKINYLLYIFIGIPMMFFSCKKTTDEVPLKTGEVLVNVKATMSNYVDGGTIKTKAAASKNIPENISQTIDLNDDLMLTTSLIPISNTNGINVNSSVVKKNGNRAATSPLVGEIWYRVVVYNKDNGRLVSQLDYQHNKTNNNRLILDGGVTYIIAAYSLNRTDVTSLDNVYNGATDLNSALFNVNGHIDFLFHYDEITIDGNIPKIDYNITFKHMTNQMEVVVDASDTEYEIERIQAKLVTEVNPNQVIKIQDGSVGTRSTSTPLNEITLDFTHTGSTSQAETFFNSNKLNALRLSELKVGEITMNWPTALNLFKDSILVSGGSKYKILLEIKPKDRYDVVNGEKVVIIGGQIWLQHNLGADKSIDANLPHQNLRGDYFQFGYKTPAFSKTASAANPSLGNWKNKISDRNHQSWNSGSEDNPVRVSTYDPCPTGFRVPTQREFETLIENTKSEFLDYNKQNARTVLYSMRKKSVQVTLPAQGTYRAEENPDRFLKNIHYQLLSMYWTSNREASDNHKTYAFKHHGGAATNLPLVEQALWKPTDPRAPTQVSPLAAIPIRCIAE